MEVERLQQVLLLELEEVPQLQVQLLSPLVVSPQLAVSLWQLFDLHVCTGLLLASSALKAVYTSSQQPVVGLPAAIGGGALCEGNTAALKIGQKYTKNTKSRIWGTFGVFLPYFASGAIFLFSRKLFPNLQKKNFIFLIQKILCNCNLRGSHGLVHPHCWSQASFSHLRKRSRKNTFALPLAFQFVALQRAQKSRRNFSAVHFLT